ncbi:MAG: hypothetical protein ACI9OJ_003513, partial [Myxococcota bacterium]
RIRALGSAGGSAPGGRATVPREQLGSRDGARTYNSPVLSNAGVLRPLLPLYAAMIVALIPVTYVPGITLSLPRLLGLL